MKDTLEWAVECGYIGMITGSFRDRPNVTEGTKEIERKFNGDVECFKRYCRMQRDDALREGRPDSATYIEHCLDDLEGFRTLFSKLPHWGGDQPLLDHPFYQWLVDNEAPRDGSAITAYLDELGFDPHLHILDAKQLRALDAVMEAYDILWMPTRTPHRLDELFFPRDNKNSRTYWLCGHGQVVLSTTLVELIEKTSVVYPLHPDHYYFEVVNDTLFIMYQHIIGSRRLCKIADKETDHDQTN